MLADEAAITIIAGHGGAGRVSYYIGRGKPSGGDGGSGGDVYATINESMTSLTRYVRKSEYQALDGGMGHSFTRTGARAEDLILPFPRGTQLTDRLTGETIELDDVPLPHLLARGGSGGWGNSRINKKNNTVFSTAHEGRPGEQKRYTVVMKLLADVGLIGLPNAGKSSLLNVLTNARADVADYPFTTLEPNLAVMGREESRVVLADIPGLIEGASEGKGLGIKFLKHIEKVHVLAHCIPFDCPDIAATYAVVRKELTQFNPALGDKQEIVLLTKIDLADSKKEITAKVKEIKKIAKGAEAVMPVTILDDESLKTLRETFFSACQRD